MRRGVRSRDTHSGASSTATSTASRRQEQLQRRQMLPRVERLFPLFVQLEMTVDWKLTVCGLVIETLQLLALTTNKDFSVFAVTGGVIENIVDFVDLPFFDPRWVLFAPVMTNIMQWASMSLTLALLATLVVHSVRDFSTMARPLRNAVRVVFHSLTSFLVVPVSLNVASLCVCNAEGNMGWLLVPCWSSFHVLYFVFGTLTLALLATLVCFSSVFIFPDEPSSANYNARPYAYVPLLTNALKIVLPVLAHVLHAYDALTAFAGLLAGLWALQLLLYATLLPYYHMHMNQLRCAEMLLLTAQSVLAACTRDVAADHVWHARYSGIVGLCLVPPCLFVGWVLPYARVNARLRDALRRLHTRRHEPDAYVTGQLPWPRGLPAHDLAVSRYAAIERVLLGTDYYAILRAREALAAAAAAAAAATTHDDNDNNTDVTGSSSGSSGSADGDGAAANMRAAHEQSQQPPSSRTYTHSAATTAAARTAPAPLPSLMALYNNDSDDDDSDDSDSDDDDVGVYGHAGRTRAVAAAEQQGAGILVGAAARGGGGGMMSDVHYNGAGGGGGDGGGDVSAYVYEDTMSVLEPYICRVYTFFDVELATRFLYEYAHYSNTASSASAATPRMCAFAARIYTKGMLRFRDNATLVYELCKMLAVYAARPQFAIAEMTRMQQRDTPMGLPLCYRVYRLSKALREQLHVPNSDQIRLAAISTKLHRETLSAMHSLWSRLASGAHLGEQIAHIADYITERREQCEAYYREVLRTPTETTLLSYSLFLEDVMFDEHTSEALRQRVAEERELQRQQRRMAKRLRQHRLRNGGGGGAAGNGSAHDEQGASGHDGGGGGGGGSVASSRNSASSSHWDSCLMVLEEAQMMHKMGGAQARLSSVAEDYRAIQRLRVFVAVAYVALCGDAIALIVVMVVLFARLLHALERVKVAWTVRTSIVIGSLVSVEIAHVDRSPFAPAETMAYAQFCAQLLANYSRAILAGHARLMTGDLVTHVARVAQWERDERIEVIEPGTLSLEGSFARSLDSIFHLGTRVGQTLARVAANLSDVDALAYMTSNARELTLSRAFNQSVLNGVREAVDARSGMLYAFVGLVSAALLLIALIYVLLHAYINRVTSMKVSIVNLFTLIPQSYLEIFCSTSEAKMRQFDEFDAQPEHVIAQRRANKATAAAGGGGDGEGGSSNNGGDTMANDGLVGDSRPLPHARNDGDSDDDDSDSSSDSSDDGSSSDSGSDGSSGSSDDKKVNDTPGAAKAATTTAGDTSNATNTTATRTPSPQRDEAVAADSDAHALVPAQSRPRARAAKRQKQQKEERWFRSADVMLAQRARTSGDDSVSLYSADKGSSSGGGGGGGTGVRTLPPRFWHRVWHGVVTALSHSHVRMALLVVTLLLAVAAMATLTMVQALTQDMRDEHDGVIAYAQALESLYAYFLTLSQHAQAYTLTGSLYHIHAYDDYASSFSLDDTFAQLVDSSGADTDTVRAAVDARAVLNSALTRLQIGMWLASRYYAITASQQPLFARIFAIEQRYDFVALQSVLERAFAPYKPQQPTSLTATVTAVDAARPPLEQLEVARNAVLDDYYRAHGYLLRDKLQALRDTHHDQRAALQRRRHAYETATLVVLAALLVTLVPLVGAYAVARRRLPALSPQRQSALAVQCVLCASVVVVAATLAVAAYAVSRTDTADTVSDCIVRFADAAANLTATVRENWLDAARLQRYGSAASRQSRWLATTQLDVYKTIFSQLFTTYLSVLPSVPMSNFQTSINAAIDALQGALYYHTIAAVLSVRARHEAFSQSASSNNNNTTRAGDDAAATAAAAGGGGGGVLDMVGDDATPSDVWQHFTYNRMLENNYGEDYLRFGNRSDVYSYLANDTANASDDALLRLALRAIAGYRYHVVSTPFEQTLNRTIVAVTSRMREEQADLQQQAMLAVTVARDLSIALLCVVAVTVLYATFNMLNYASTRRQRRRGDKQSHRQTSLLGADNDDDDTHATSGSASAAAAAAASSSSSSSSMATTPTSSSSSAQQQQQQQQRTARRHRAAKCRLLWTLLLLACFFVVLLVLALYTINSSSTSQLLTTLIAHDGIVVDTIAAAQRVWVDTPDVTQVSPYVAELSRSVARLLRAHEQLYLGSASGDFAGMITVSRDQATLLFGDTHDERAEYAAPCIDTPPPPGYDALEYVSLLNATPGNLARLFCCGLDTVQWQLTNIYLLMLEETNMTRLRAYHASFLVILQQLTTSLDTSSSMVFDSVRRDTVTAAAAYLAVAGVLVVCLLALYLAVYRPLLRHLVHQGKGARLLLEMIPANIRREVPAIHEYFQTGNVNSDMDIVNAAYYDIQLSDLLVVISQDDLILRTTPEMLRRFQRTEREVLGKSVGVLLSKDRAAVVAEYRKQHGHSVLHTYCGKYMRTTGLCSDGTTFPMQIMIREVCLTTTSDGGRHIEKCFVCQFANIGVTAELEAARAVQASVFHGSRRAQLLLDRRGVVRLANRAALRLFAAASERDLLERNANAFLASKGAFHRDAYFTQLAARIAARRYRDAHARGNAAAAATATTTNSTSAAAGGGSSNVSSSLAMTTRATAAAEATRTRTPPRAPSSAAMTLVGNNNSNNNNTTAATASSPSQQQVAGTNTTTTAATQLGTSKDATMRGRVSIRRGVHARKRDGTLFEVDITIVAIDCGGAGERAAPMTQRHRYRHRHRARRAHDHRRHQQQQRRQQQQEQQQRRTCHHDDDDDDGDRTDAQQQSQQQRRNRHGRRRRPHSRHTGGGGGVGPLLLLHLTDLTAGYTTMQTEAVSRVLMDRSPIPVLELDVGGRVLYFSPAAERSWGYAAERVLGVRLCELLHGTDATRYNFAYTAHSHLLYFLDATRVLAAQHRSGSMFTTEVAMRAVRRGDGVSIVAYFRDLSAEVSASQRNILSQWAFDCAFVPILVTDGNGVVQCANVAAERQYGLTNNNNSNNKSRHSSSSSSNNNDGSSSSSTRAGTLQGCNINVLLLDSTAQQSGYYREHYSSHITSASPSLVRQEYVKRADGQLVPVELCVQAITVSNNSGNNNCGGGGGHAQYHYYGGGEAASHNQYSSGSNMGSSSSSDSSSGGSGRDTARRLYVNYIRDVSANYQLQRVGDVHDEVTQRCPTPMLSFDDAGRVLSCNAAADRLFGCHARALIGGDVRDVLPGLLRRGTRHRRHRRYGRRNNNDDNDDDDDDNNSDVANNNDNSNNEGNDDDDTHDDNDDDDDEQQQHDDGDGNDVYNTTQLPARLRSRAMRRTAAAAAVASPLSATTTTTSSSTTSSAASSMYVSSSSSSSSTVACGTRFMTARHSSGTAIPVEVHVREATSGLVLRRVYVAAVVDVSVQTHVDAICAVERAYTELSPHAVLVVNGSGVVRFASDAAVRLLRLRSRNEATSINDYLIATTTTAASGREAATTPVASSRAAKRTTAMQQLLRALQQQPSSSSTAQPRRAASALTTCLMRCQRADRDTFTAHVTLRALLDRRANGNNNNNSGGGMLGDASASATAGAYMWLHEEDVYLVTLHDCAQRQLLQQSCALQTTLLTQLRFLAVMRVTASCTITYVNAALLRLLRYHNNDDDDNNNDNDDERQLLGKPLRTIVSPALATSCEVWLRRFFATGGDGSGRLRCEQELLRRDGTRVSVELTAVTPDSRQHNDDDDDDDDDNSSGYSSSNDDGNKAALRRKRSNSSDATTVAATAEEEDVFVFVRPISSVVDARDTHLLIRELIATSPVPALLLRPLVDTTTTTTAAAEHYADAVVMQMNAAAHVQFACNDSDASVVGRSVQLLCRNNNKNATTATTTLMQQYSAALRRRQCNGNNSRHEVTTTTATTATSSMSVVLHTYGVTCATATQPSRVFAMRVCIMPLPYMSSNNNNDSNDSSSPLLLMLVEELTEQLRLQMDCRISATVADACPLALVVVDAAGRVVLFTGQAEQLFAWREREVVGKNALQTLFTAPDDDDDGNDDNEDNDAATRARLCLRALPPCVASSSTSNTYDNNNNNASSAAVHRRRVLAYRRDGDAFVADVRIFCSGSSSASTADDDATTTATTTTTASCLRVLLIRDVTHEPVSAAHAAQQSSATLRAVSVPLIVFTSRGVVQFANDALTQLLGVTTTTTAATTTTTTTNNSNNAAALTTLSRGLLASHAENALIGQHVRQLVCSSRTATSLYERIVHMCSSSDNNNNNSSSNYASSSSSPASVVVYATLRHGSGVDVPVQLTLCRHDDDTLSRTSVLAYVRDMRAHIAAWQQHLVHDGIASASGRALLLVSSDSVVYYGNDTALQLLYGPHTRAHDNNNNNNVIADDNENDDDDTTLTRTTMPCDDVWRLGDVLPTCPRIDDLVTLAAATAINNNNSSSSSHKLLRLPCVLYDGTRLVCVVHVVDVPEADGDVCYGCAIDVADAARSLEISPRVLLDVVTATQQRQQQQQQSPQVHERVSSARPSLSDALQPPQTHSSATATALDVSFLFGVIALDATDVVQYINADAVQLLGLHVHNASHSNNNSSNTLATTTASASSYTLPAALLRAVHEMRATHRAAAAVAREGDDGDRVQQQQQPTSMTHTRQRTSTEGSVATLSLPSRRVCITHGDNVASTITTASTTATATRALHVSVDVQTLVSGAVCSYVYVRDEAAVQAARDEMTTACAVLGTLPMATLLVSTSDVVTAEWRSDDDTGRSSDCCHVIVDASAMATALFASVMTATRSAAASASSSQQQQPSLRGRQLHTLLSVQRRVDSRGSDGQPDTRDRDSATSLSSSSCTLQSGDYVVQLRSSEGGRHHSAAAGVAQPLCHMHVVEMRGARVGAMHLCMLRE